MTKLDEVRMEIDLCDEQIAQLFERRFTAVQQVIAYKIENHLPILDSGREEIIKKKNRDRIQNESLKMYYAAWYEELLKLSKEYQKEILDKQ